MLPRLHQSLRSTGLGDSYWNHKESFWVKKGNEKALELFQNVSQRVPAYKDFLKKNKISPEKIKTHHDLQSIPPVSKKNYLYEYPLEMLCWDGTLRDKALVFTSTSGSTGKPVYFPRDEVLDWQSSVMHEFFLKNISGGGNKIPSTLVVVCFGMGIWIGGIITYQAFRSMALRKGYPITLATPGIHKKEILEIIKNLNSQFDQIVLCGYPPFIKDLLDEGSLEGIDWQDLKMKFIFAAEGFSEEFRNSIIKTANLQNPYRDMMNIYGSADLGTMAIETPLSILARNKVHGHPELEQDVFAGANRTPTLAQFNPLFIQFDTLDNSLLCTGNNTVPLIRYDIGDHGGVSSFSSMMETFKSRGITLETEVERLSLNDTIVEWPFVYVYERADFSASLYGIIIYPEHIREAILNPVFENFLTGKFTMQTKYDESNNQYLEINVELKKDAPYDAALGSNIQEFIVKNLMLKNQAYHHLISMIKDRAEPRINCLTYGDELYFKSGTKHRWVRA